MSTAASAELLPVSRRGAALSLLAGVVGSGVLLALYSRGGALWPFGLVMLVPWLWSMQRVASMRAAVLAGILMAVAYVLAALAWFGAAFGSYVGIGALPATGILLLCAPLLQPQIVAYAVVRRIAHRRSPALRAVAAASAWVATEWLCPKLLGDTLGHGLQPSTWLRQVADLGGAAGLTVLLLLGNEGVATALSAGRSAWRPLALVAALWAAAAGYGGLRLSQLQAYWASPAPALRVGLVQANLVDLERRRAEQGAYATVRHILDTHLAMSERAVREQGAQALLWSETVYPTTFGSPKSPDGAALDAELLAAVARLGVPLMFGTYDRDAAGEYNSAAVIDPQRGLLGHYRKTHLFPLTEWVPESLDGPSLRRWLPWTGTWRPGAGARVFPLRAADGTEAVVLPLICLDDVRPALALDGARLGAQAILGLSNDSWFTAYPAGARLHLTVASFRSIETRLPQLRVTSNGMSALIDESGDVLMHTEMGQQAVLVGEIPLRDPAPTLMVRWGDWVGAVACLLLVLALLVEIGGRFLLPIPARSDASPDPAHWSRPIVLLSPVLQRTLVALEFLSLSGLLWLVVRMAGRDGWQVNSLDQVLIFAMAVVLPSLLAWGIRQGNAGQARVAGDALVLDSGSGRVELPLAAIRRVQVAHRFAPRATVVLEDSDGRRPPWLIEVDDAPMLIAVLRAAGAVVNFGDPGDADRAARIARRAAAGHRWLDHGAMRFAVFPLLLALPAFRLHQMITFGGTFGEWQNFGASAWFSGLLIWWAAWSLGSMLVAAVLRVLIETAVLILDAWLPGQAPRVRQALERSGRAAFFLGPPIWLASKAFWG